VPRAVPDAVSVTLELRRSADGIAGHLDVAAILVHLRYGVTFAWAMVDFVDVTVQAPSEYRSVSPRLHVVVADGSPSHTRCAQGSTRVGFQARRNTLCHPNGGQPNRRSRYRGCIDGSSD